jgi:hypothetical protein
MTWTPGLKFAAINAIAACVATTCQSDCQARAAQKQWPAAMCAAAPPTDAAVDPPMPVDAGEPPPPVVDAAAPRDAMAVTAPVDAGAHASVDAGDVRTPHTPAGCSCQAAPFGPTGARALLWLLPALLRWPRRRRR